MRVNKLTGTFYFKRTSYGNLIGEFTNNVTKKVQTESAMPTEATVNFVGEYDSIWFDDSLHKSTLTISEVQGKFELHWSEGGKAIFIGEGIEVDNMLIGQYRPS
jgi:hypothetical protein